MGGATDAKFLFGLGHTVGTHVLPKHGSSVARSLHHYLDEDARVPSDALSVEFLTEDTTNLPPRRPIWSKDKSYVHGEGLFPTRRPDTLVACPSYYFKEGLRLR